MKTALGLKKEVQLFIFKGVNWEGVYSCKKKGTNKLNMKPE